MITIVRVYDKQRLNTHREYCGRSGKGQIGLLGNPFAANVDHSNRDEVCDKYHTYFHSNIPQRAKDLVEIAKTQDIELACFCAPKRCHTETIKAYIEQQLEKSKMNTQEIESIGIIKPITNQMECIPSFRNELAFLSNMYQCPVVSHQYHLTFQSVESAYQAMKCPERILEFWALDGYEAKRLGKQVELRSDWNEVKLSIMEKILRAKFQDELLQKLLAVKGEIVERNNWGDSYWGICNGRGENHLGKLLMKIRDEAIENDIEFREPRIDDCIYDPAPTMYPELFEGSVKQQIPSMTYAEIGSRRTDDATLLRMTDLANELESMGFKLYSGAADEILSEDLNSPVDFVICWTPDGAETKTGQAIRLANRYGIPVINMFNTDWKQRLDVLLEDIHILNQANQISLSTY